jgi:hypothetical protein
LKATFSLIAMLATFLAFMPYILAITKGATPPHVFSWVIWGTSTIIVFFAQLKAGSGVGAWPIGLSALITMTVAWLAWYKGGDAAITRMDWGFLLASLSALPVWFYTSDPLWAIIILTLVDLMGFGPTVRKAYSKPNEEQMTFYMLCFFRNALVIAALETYSLATLLFPSATGLACVLLVLMMALRRAQLSR